MPELAWKTFTEDEWFNFTESEWAGFLERIPGQVESTGDIVSGSFPISESSRDGVYLCNVRLDSVNDHNATTSKIVVGGIPLTLCRSNTGIYIIACIVDNTADTDVNTVSIFGKPFELKRIGGRFSLRVNEVGGSEGFKEMMWKGTPIATDNSNNLILAAYEPVTDADQEVDVMIGGLPILARRFGSDWYLVISTA